MNHKAGISITHWMIGIFLFAFVIVGFYIIPKDDFWVTYGYTPNVSLTSFDKSRELQGFSSDVSCDVTGIGNSSDGVPCKPRQTGGITEFLGFLDNAKSGLYTFFRTIGVMKDVTSDIQTTTASVIPTKMMDLIVALIITLVVLALIMLAFNKGDV